MANELLYKVGITLADLESANADIHDIITSFASHTALVATKIHAAHPVLVYTIKEVVSFHLREMAYLADAQNRLEQMLFDAHFVDVKRVGVA